MIVVVEGVSASGKSSWCGLNSPMHTLAENGRLQNAPDRNLDPSGAARFWAECNVARWQAALALEQKASVAVCDTDPLKLHYIWCLWKAGRASEHDWLSELAATRQTMADGRIGFADVYLVATIAPEMARERAAADGTRRRRNLDLHLSLQPALLGWYSALGSVLPDRVRFGLPQNMPTLIASRTRYDLAAFDAMIERLRGWIAPTK